MYSGPIPPTTHPTATTLPYDVLREIFLHCLPDDPLDRLQPNRHDPPMLLCYVCSYWRKVALASPSLWSHIYYRLPIRWDIEGQPIIWDLNSFKTGMKILKWWRNKQDFMAPFIRFQYYQEHGFDSEEWFLEGDDMQFFIEYLSSAQYLDVGPFARYLFTQDSASRISVAAPNLHTLVAYYEDDAFADIFGQTTDPTLARILPFHHIAPALRRLSIHFEGHLHRTFIDSFSNWSRLTHLSMHKVTMNRNVWFSIMRGVVHLQWGFFWIAIRQGEDDARARPSKSTLPFLSTLSLQAFNKHDGHSESETLSSLFQDLHLPVLHNLTIYMDVDSGDLPGGIMTINTLLKSMPAVRDLILGLNFEPPFDLGLPSANWEAVEKLSTLASNLTHLQLDMTYTHRPWNSWILNGILAQWKKILSPKQWLDLGSSTNGIRKITAFVLKPYIYGRLVESSLRSALALDDEEQEKKVENIVLEVVSMDEFIDASEKWMTWGAR